MVYELIDKYYKDFPDLRNVLVTHSEQVRDMALQIADKHPELNIDQQFIAEAAMLHDIGIIFCDAPRIFCYGSHKYIEHGYLGAQLLREEGLPRHARVAERHTGSGLTLEDVIAQNLPIPHQDYCPQTIEEELICYADKFFSKGHLGEKSSDEKVRRTIWMYGHDSVVRFQHMEEKFRI